jgi:hypothetical protein
MLFFFSTCRKKVLSRLVKKQILQLDLIWRNKSPLLFCYFVYTKVTRVGFCLGVTGWCVSDRSVADLDPGSGAFLSLDQWIQITDEFFLDPGFRIPIPYF